MNYFSVQTIAFSLWKYDVSWLELVGTILNLWGVWLMTRNRILTWPVGIVGVVVFMLLFWQIQLYADFFEQIYYIVTGFWGWWLWHRSGAPDGGTITRNTPRQNALMIAALVVFSIVAGWGNANLNLWLPKIFTQAASFAYLDATTTVMSFCAQFIMARRRLECWYIWITVDVIGIWLYWQKGTVFLSALYAIFLVLATYGLLNWLRQERRQLASENLQIARP